MMDMLPKGNKCVLDRLMYHLARVAHQESVNKMSASNLAVKKFFFIKKINLKNYF